MRRRQGLVPGLLVVLGGLLATAAEERSGPPVSSYAPSDDLRQQLDAYYTQLERDLTSGDAYDQDRQSRVAKDANTVIVLAQALGNYDGDVPEKKASLAMVQAARQLVDGAGDLQAARAALGQLQAARSASGQAAGWSPVADLPLLMKQVPVVNNSLRSGVNGRHFERSAQRNLGYAATLAVLAQASSLDTSYCSDEEDERTWRELCATMRDATADVRRAVQAKDQKQAQAALGRVVTTCDACHHRFRD